MKEIEKQNEQKLREVNKSAERVSAGEIVLKNQHSTRPSSILIVC